MNHCTRGVFTKVYVGFPRVSPMPRFGDTLNIPLYAGLSRFWSHITRRAPARVLTTADRTHIRISESKKSGDPGGTCRLLSLEKFCGQRKSVTQPAVFGTLSSKAYVY